MSEKYDAIIIGTGIIGCCIALELARKGYRTLNVDKEPAAGYGSTSASCAIIRTHYSTFDGTAMAFEAFHYWNSWRDYLGVEDERGTAEFKVTGCSVIRSEVDEKMDAILGHFKKAGLALLVSAGKGTFLIAEKFGFKEVFRDGRTIYLDKRLVAPGAVAMDKFR